VPLGAFDWQALTLTHGNFLAEKVTLAQNVFTELCGNFAVASGKARVTDGSLKFADGAIKGDADLTLPSQLDTLHLTFTGLHQEVLTRALYPDVFTAEGPISGSLTLEGQIGLISVTADQPGILKISRDASRGTFAPVARAALGSQDTILPGNFDDIVSAQLADYPYLQGNATFRDSPRGMTIDINYRRRPLQEGDPGYNVPVTLAGQQIRANLPIHISGSSITMVNYSIRHMLQALVGFRNDLVAPASHPATRPAP